MTKRAKLIVVTAVLVGVGAISYHAFAGPSQGAAAAKTSAPQPGTGPSQVAAAEKVPLLNIRAIAGEKSGEDFCYSCYRANSEYAVVFVGKWNGMVAGFAKQLEDLKADHPKFGVGLILLDKSDGLAARVKKDLGDAELTVTTIGVPDGDTGWADVKNWAIDDEKQTNAIVVENREARTRFTAGCPHCEGVAAKIAKSL